FASSPRTSDAFQNPTRGVLLECRHAAQAALAGEMRKAPLHLLDDVGTGGVHRLAKMREDRLREIGGLIDIRVLLSDLAFPSTLLQRSAHHAQATSSHSACAAHATMVADGGGGENRLPTKSITMNATSDHRTLA